MKAIIIACAIYSFGADVPNEVYEDDVMLELTKHFAYEYDLSERDPSEWSEGSLAEYHTSGQTDMNTFEVICTLKDELPDLPD